MKILRSRRFYIILACVLVFAILIAGVGLAFRYFTKGELYEADGLKQNSLIRLEDVAYSDGKVHFTVVNETSHKIGSGANPIVEKLIDGTWQYFPLYRGNPAIACIHPAFSRTEKSFTVDYNQDQLPGSYRLVYDTEYFSTDENGNVSAVWQEDRACFIVGYLTIGEEYATSTDIRYTGGLRQSDNVSLSIRACEPHPLYKYEYVFKNNGTKPLVLDVKEFHSLERYAKAENGIGYFEGISSGQRWPEENVVIPPQSEYVLPFCLNRGGALDDLHGFERDGHYRYYMECYWEGEEATSFNPCVIFDVVNGALS